MAPIISVKKIRKDFHAHTAVKNISFNVNRGDVLGFLGPNGAGKTTTMRMITGYLQPTSGNITILGNDISDKPIIAQQNIGYLPEGGPVYSDMGALDFLHFIGQIRGLSGNMLKSRLDFVIEQLYLKDVLYQNIETLSKGFKRRVALAQAIIHDPDILILDEPTDGLDPNQKKHVRSLIGSMAKNKAIIISTHILEEARAICNNTIIIANGKIVASGSPDEIALKSTGISSVKVSLKKDAADKILDAILKIRSVDKVQMEGKKTIIASSKNGKSILNEISNVLYAKQYQIQELYEIKGNFDDAFSNLTSK